MHIGESHIEGSQKDKKFALADIEGAFNNGKTEAIVYAPTELNFSTSLKESLLTTRIVESKMVRFNLF